MRLLVPALPPPASVPVAGLKVRFPLVKFENGVALPPAPGIVALTVTVELERVDVATDGGTSALIALLMLVAAEVAVVPTLTSPVVLRVATQVNVCGPTTNCWPAVPAPETLIVPEA